MAGKNTYAFMLVSIEGHVTKKKPIRWIWSRPKCKQEMQVELQNIEQKKRKKAAG